MVGVLSFPRNHLRISNWIYSACREIPARKGKEAINLIALVERTIWAEKPPGLAGEDRNIPGPLSLPGTGAVSYSYNQLSMAFTAVDEQQLPSSLY